jgi:methionyl-tRNA formyltransferase
MLGRTKLKVGGRYFSIEAVSSAHGIPLSKIRSINSDESISLIKKEAPDLIVSLSASQIFSKRVIGLANWATINVHNAPLPKYQGLMPSFWVLCNGETETATTVHLVAEKIDAGDMVVQKRVEIDGDETLNSLITKTKLITVDVLVEAFNLFQEHGGRPPTKAMAQEEATYFSFPERKDIARFRRAGRRLLWKHIY